MRLHRPARRLLVALLAAAVGAVGAPTRRATAGDAPARPAPTDEEKVDYWLARLRTGSEPTTFLPPSYHLNLLLDTQRNLVALAPLMLDRLADEARQREWMTMGDVNPWHGVMPVLAVAGASRPDVVHAWAVPGLGHSLLTLRRASLTALGAVATQADGPLLVAALERDAADRQIGPTALRMLLRLGEPWDGAAARAAHAGAAADLPSGGASLWNALPAESAAAPSGARPDLLAWWALLAESSGPRGPDPRTASMRPQPVDAGAPSRVLDASHALTDGREAAAFARAALAGRGFGAFDAAVRRDAAGGDPLVARPAREALRDAPSPEERRARREALRRLAEAAASDPTSVQPAEARDAVRALDGDPDPEAVAVLRRALAAWPTRPAWLEPILEALRGVVGRTLHDGGFVDALLASGDPAKDDLALHLVRSLKHLCFLDTLEARHEDPALAPLRPRLRREICFLYALGASQGVLDAERVAAFARRLPSWVEDPADRSGTGLASVLIDLGPVGEAVLAERLRGPRRALWMPAVSQRTGRYLSEEVARALADGVGPDTPVAERRATLAALFLVASGSSAGILDDLARRLNAEGAADVETIARIVRHRAAR